MKIKGEKVELPEAVSSCGSDCLEIGGSSSFVSVKAVGEGSGNSESTSGINLPLFTYEINK